MPGRSAELVQQLYRTPPDRFVAARDAAVADARRAGDPATAREIARLRKPDGGGLAGEPARHPTAPSWSPTWCSSPTRCASPSGSCAGPGCGSCPRSGGRWSAPWSPRSAGSPRPSRTRRPANRLPLAEVEATLNAALSDAEVAEQVRAGRLLRAASYAGFGEVPRPQLRLVTGDDARRREAERRPAGPAGSGAVPRRHAARAGARRARRAGCAAGGPGRAGPASAAPWTGSWRRPRPTRSGPRPS